MNEIYYYSAKNNAFYAESWRELYESSPEGWPDDAKAISTRWYQYLMNAHQHREIIANAQGYPMLKPWDSYNWPAIARMEAENRMRKAQKACEPYQIDLMLGMIDDDDREKLVAIRQYVKQLKELNLDALTTREKYLAYKWPEAPAM